jgi:hypothetical protein
MQKKHFVILILAMGFLLPIYAGENEVPEQVGKYADEQMEAHISKQGRRIGSAERSAVVEPEAKKSAVRYKFHYSFSYGTFRCAITVNDKKGKLTVSERPSCFENEMP